MPLPTCEELAAKFKSGCILRFALAWSKNGATKLDVCKSDFV